MRVMQVHKKLGVNQWKLRRAELLFTSSLPPRVISSFFVSVLFCKIMKNKINLLKIILSVGSYNFTYLVI